MSSIIDALPGQTLPVADVKNTLAAMWQVEAHNGRPVSEFRASQMNLILHFGKNISVEDAQNQFHTAISFAQRYPCRIIVLCPEDDQESQENFLEAKLYSQCFIGKDQREMCCCEALMLGYFTKQNDFLENQVSVWLENDLPIYYWFHGMPAKRIRERWLPFLKQCRTVVYDSSFEADDYSEIDWPREHMTHDLANARLLPIRQALGQFFSGYQPQQIASDLKNISVSHAKNRKGEAKQLCIWLKECLEQCYALLQIEHEPPAIEIAAHDGSDKHDISVIFGYTKEDCRFEWRFCDEERRAIGRTQFNGNEQETTMRAKYTNPGKSLAEALFFN